MKKQSVFSALIKTLGYVLLFWGAQIAASLLSELVILFRAGMEGVSSGAIIHQSIQTALYSVTYEMMFLSAILFAAIVHLIHKGKAFSPFKPKNLSAKAVFGVILLGFGCFWLANQLISLSSLIPAVRTSQNEYMDQHEAILQAGTSFLFELLYTCIGAPIIEEWLCRGLIQNTLKKSMRPAFAILLSGILFSLIHGNLYQIVFTLPLGILLSFLAHRFGTILPSVLLHSAFNFANYPVRLGLYLGYSENDTATLFLAFAAMLFYALSLPLGMILIRRALPKTKGQENKIQSEGDSMASPEFMIVGLGNPDAKYQKNRHNCGFLAIDAIAENASAPIRNLRFSALTGEAMIGGKKVLLLKPQTYMNLSGKAVSEAARFYKIPPEKILVLFDDISFAPGIFRIRASGSAGGHNGIKSIISSLSSDAFPRVKIGVGNPPEGWELMNWVLGNPSAEDEAKIRATFSDVVKTAELFVDGKIDLAAQSFNGKMHG